MATLNLKEQVVEEILDYPVLVSRFANESEQRRVTRRKRLIGFHVETPFATKTDMQAYRDFLIARVGKLNSFDYTSPFDDVTYTVRFNSPIRTRYARGVFKCVYDLVILDYPEE